ncbi:sulfatase [Planctomycetota bacterium]
MTHLKTYTPLLLQELNTFIVSFLLLPSVLLSPLNAAQNPSPSRPNVLFIAIEDFSPKHFGCYGGRAITPNIDALAQEGVIFKNAFCASPVCNPSRTSLLTGLRPQTSGVYGNADNWQKLALPKILKTLPQHFKDNGYEALKVGKLYHYQMEHPESWSRELPSRIEGRPYLSAWDPAVVPKLKTLDGVEGDDWFSQNLHWGPVDCEPNAFRDGHYATSVANYLREEHDKPFFLAVGFHAPHIKFGAPKAFFNLYDVNAIEIPDNPSHDLADIPLIDSNNIIHRVLDAATWRDIKRAQFACISYVDWCFGHIREILKETNLEKDTAVVVWTDHGFLLGEHFQWSKGGNKLFEEGNNVGLIWRVPGLPPAGRVSQSVVETIDIFPTLFDLCGISIPKHVEGKSFVPLLKNPSLSWKQAAFTWGTSNRISIQTERFRFNTNIDLNPNFFELYDHQIDPNEYINVSGNPQYAETIETLIAHYQAHIKTYPVGHL